MIQYTADDLIEKALALADLQNSDFLSYKEKITYLNDTYQYMYNKAIDYGDNIFTKEILITGDTFDLPYDFYQLREVYYLHNKIKTLVTPKPQNQSLSYISYEIKNNVLYIYGDYKGELYVSYYKIPDTLFVRPPKKELLINGISSTSEEFNTFNSLKNYVFNDYVYMYDKKLIDILSNITVNELELPSDVDTKSLDFQIKVLGKSYFLLGTKDGTWQYLPYFDNASKTLSFTISNKNVLLPFGSNSDFVFVVYKGNVYLYPITEDETVTKGLYVFTNNSSEEINKYCVNTVTLFKEIDLSDFDIENPSTSIIYITDELETDNVMVFDLNGKGQIADEQFDMYDTYDSPEDLSNFNVIIKPNDKTYGKFILILCENGFVYGMNTISQSLIYITKTDEDVVLLSTNGFNPDNGYGLITYNPTTNKLELDGMYQSTELSYPNNTYFTLMSYYLAILFCMKQNKDVSALSVQLEVQEHTFYDSLHRDETSFRIVNVDSYI